MNALSRMSGILTVLAFLLPLSLPAFQAFNPTLDRDSIKPGYRSGVISNEALPPEETEKELEKRQRAYEKFKTLKDYQPSTTGGGVGNKKNNPIEEVEEFYVEHEISEKSARTEAKKLNLTLLSEPAGCEECTRKEMEYCGGSQVINDHCCCDGKYTEVFPFVPHTCYLGSTRCRPVAADCGEYMRLRTCCCEKHLAAKWKATLSKASHGTSNLFTKLCFIMFGVVSSCLVLRLIFTGN